jgi:hypothetical protein
MLVFFISSQKFFTFYCLFGGQTLRVKNLTYIVAEYNKIF